MSSSARWSVGLGLVVLVVAGFLVWIGASAWQASKVSISSTELLECKDPASIAPAADRDDEFSEPGEYDGALQAVKLDRRLDCLLRTQVASTADVPVTVERLEWAVLGPEAGSGAVASWPHQGGPEVVDDNYGSRVDAIFDLSDEGSLESDDRTQFAVRVTFNEGGCVGPGVTIGLTDSPTAQIRVLGRTHTIRATGAGVGFRATPESRSGCDEDENSS